LQPLVLYSVLLALLIHCLPQISLLTDLKHNTEGDYFLRSLYNKTVVVQVEGEYLISYLQKWCFTLYEKFAKGGTISFFSCLIYYGNFPF
jgi:hypothetical protein